MSSKYSISCSGTTIDVTVTDSASVVKQWLREHRQLIFSNVDSPVIVGLDCKEKQPYRNITIATLQLCVGTKCLIVQLYHLDYIHQSLKSVFSDPNVIFVGFNPGNDVNNLRTCFSLACTNVVSISQLAVRRYRMSCPRLKEIAEKFAGLNVSNEPEHLLRSDWEARELSLEQIERACIDAYACLKIGQALIVI